MHTKLFNIRPLVIGLLAVSCLWADSRATTPTQSNMSTSSDYICIQRGPHSKVWRRAVLTTNQSGVVRTNLHSYTELATGLCYLHDGQYVDSVEQIEIVGQSAQAIHGPCKVQWAADASTAGGAVQLTSPGGHQFALLKPFLNIHVFDSSKNA
jgi:hypothetical protein